VADFALITKVEAATSSVGTGLLVALLAA